MYAPKSDLVSEFYFKLISMKNLNQINMCLPYVDKFVAINNNFSFEGVSSAIIMGAESKGNNSVSVNSGHALANYSFAANYRAFSYNKFSNTF